MFEFGSGREKKTVAFYLSTGLVPEVVGNTFILLRYRPLATFQVFLRCCVNQLVSRKNVTIHQGKVAKEGKLQAGVTIQFSLPPARLNF